MTGEYVDRHWQSFLRRFDLGHTFRFAKQTQLDPPQAADSRGCGPLELSQTLDQPRA
ncbi:MULTISPECIES: hypothetical protein [unclassified Streptomyces]|uniref:hypothetical protein n=1 Tax=unclassified Streptomyces TaxID=2593676 RepID=UPI0035DA99D2|nr:hypothetical protein OG395_51950 [Streptomyces sp. NBC_01320]